MGVLFAIETEEKKTEFSIIFHLDHNNAPWLSQRNDQRSRQKTYRQSRKKLL